MLLPFECQALLDVGVTAERRAENTEPLLGRRERPIPNPHGGVSLAPQRCNARWLLACRWLWPFQVLQLWPVWLHCRVQAAQQPMPPQARQRRWTAAANHDASPAGTGLCKHSVTGQPAKPFVN